MVAVAGAVSVRWRNESRSRSQNLVHGAQYSYVCDWSSVLIYCNQAKALGNPVNPVNERPYYNSLHHYWCLSGSTCTSNVNRVPERIWMGLPVPTLSSHS